MSVALLAVNYSTDLERLKSIHYKDLMNLFNDKLIQRSQLAIEYFELFNELKQLREATNYEFRTNLKTHIYYKIVGLAFDSGIEFIKNISKIIKDKFDLQLRINSMIGNGFGDDILQIFLSEEDQNRVWNYLIKKELTT